MATHGYYYTRHWKSLRKAAFERDAYRCTQPGCLATATVVDHIITRPRLPYPTAVDTLENLRSLCAVHDMQLKERPNGLRPHSLTLKGCDANGWPHWLASRQ